ncbi:MAG: recombinase family protein [Chloroflexi bacterium]|nr:recombinase family protein [Chloroflexota bacterium]
MCVFPFGLDSRVEVKLVAPQPTRFVQKPVQQSTGEAAASGRLVYMRTKWVRGRSSKTGHSYRGPVERPEEDWIPIEGASPRIVDDALFQRVQEILNDPERNPPAGDRVSTCFAAASSAEYADRRWSARRCGARPAATSTSITPVATPTTAGRDMTARHDMYAPTRWSRACGVRFDGYSPTRRSS